MWFLAIKYNKAFKDFNLIIIFNILFANNLFI